MLHNRNLCLTACAISMVIDIRRSILIAAVLFAIALQNTQVFPADPASSASRTIESCRTITDAALRLRCFEDVTSDRTQPSSASPKNLDGWRLVRTPGPKGGGDVISMMRTADMLRSDPDFAGLSLHCGQKGPEILVIVVQPFPPRSQPRVTLGSTVNEAHFEASVLPSGAALLLPDHAMALANGPWQSLVDLPIKIEDGDTTIRGVVPLSGLNTVLQTLMASCPPH